MLGFLFGRVPVATGLRLFAAADVVTATAVHDEKPRKNITDITTTATDQEKDENVVIATASTICTTVCKEAVHYVNPLCYLDCSYCTIRNQKFLCSLFLQFGWKSVLDLALIGKCRYIIFCGLHQETHRCSGGVVLHARSGVVLFIFAENWLYMVQFTC